MRREVVDRLDASALTYANLEAIQAEDDVRPSRWPDYLDAYEMFDKPVGALWQCFRPTMPFAIIDLRLADLALRFFDAPEESLLQGFRRLESLLRKRIKSDENGLKLISRAFENASSRLVWLGVDGGESKGRLSLFKGAYLAYRNPRAHTESSSSVAVLLGEFLVVNQLFVLEAAASERPNTASA